MQNLTLCCAAVVGFNSWNSMQWKPCYI